MKMCTECYELFDSRIQLEDCPIYRCDGDLVDVDDEIAEIISLMNKEFWFNELPIRTLFTCAGHLRYTITPYIGFELMACNDEDAKYLAEFFSDNFLGEHVKKLNSEILKVIPNTAENNKYEIEYSILPDKMCEYCPKYRLFVNGYRFSYPEANESQEMKAISQIQLLFKNFLIDLMDSIKTLDLKEKEQEDGNKSGTNTDIQA